MKRVIAVVVMLLMCSTAAFAGTSIRVGGLYGNYDFKFGPLSMNSNGLGGYVGLTSYLDSVPVGFTGSYSLFMADKYVVTGSIPVEDSDETVHDDKNNAALLKAFAGYTLPGFGITLGGGWVSLTHTLDDDGEIDTFTNSGFAIAAFTTIAASPKLEVSVEAFYAPKADFLAEAPGTGMGGELRGSYSILPLVGVEVGASAVRFTPDEAEGFYVQNVSVFGGVKLTF
jgi:hypothetical protein